MDFPRPDSISGSLPPAFQLTRLIQVSNIYIGEKFFSFFPTGKKESRGFCSNGLFFDGLGGFSACEAERPIRKIFGPQEAPFRQHTVVRTGVQHG